MDEAQWGGGMGSFIWSAPTAVPPPITTTTTMCRYGAVCPPPLFQRGAPNPTGSPCTAPRPGCMGGLGGGGEPSWWGRGGWAAQPPPPRPPSVLHLSASHHQLLCQLLCDVCCGGQWGRVDPLQGSPLPPPTTPPLNKRPPSPAALWPWGSGGPRRGVGRGAVRGGLPAPAGERSGGAVVAPPPLPRPGCAPPSPSPPTHPL